MMGGGFGDDCGDIQPYCKVSLDSCCIEDGSRYRYMGGQE